MVETKIISKSKFLDLYSKNSISKPFRVTVGLEQRIYGLTTVGEAENPDGYVVVYAVV